MKHTNYKSGKASRFIFSCVTAFALLGMPSSYAAALDDSTMQLMEDAKSYIQEGDFNAAIIQYKNAARKNPNNGDIRLKLAQTYLSVGQGLVAEKELKKAQQNGVDPAVLQYPFARAYWLMRNFESILEKTSLDKVQQSDRPALLTLHSYAYLQAGNSEKAEELARNANEINPDYPLAIDALAGALMSRAQFVEAEKEIDAFKHTQNKLSDRLWHRKAELRRMAGDLDGAVNAYSEGLDANANYLPLRAGRAIIEINRNNLESASADIDFILSQQPEHIIGKYLKSLKLWKSQEFKEADDTLTSMGEGINAYRPALLLMSNVKIAVGEFVVAENYIKRYLTEQPQDARALATLGRIQLRQGQREDAIITLEKAETVAPDNFIILMLLGNAYLQNKDFEKSTAIFERGQAINPENTSLRTQAAFSQMGMGNDDTAIESLEKLLSEGKEVQRVGLVLISTYIRKKEFDEAERVAKKLAENLPDNPLPTFFSANILRDRGQIDAAKVMYQDLITKYPDYTAARLSLAKLELQSGDVAQAQVNLQKILDENPDSLSALGGLARSAELRGDIKQAEEYLLHAIETKPNLIQLQQGMVGLLLRSNREQDALVYANKMVSNFPDVPAAMMVLAETSMAVKDFDTAIEYVGRVVELLPQNTSVRFLQARVYLAADNTDLAKVSLEQVLSINPQHVPARNLLARVTAKTEGVDSAMSIAQADTDDAANIEIKRAILLVEAGRHEEAINLFASQLENNPSFPVVKLHFDAITSARGIEEGLSWLKGWVDERQKDDKSAILLAHNLLAQGRFDEAAHYYEILTKLVPDNPVPWNNLAWIYGESGDARAIETAKIANDLSPKSALIGDTYGWLLFQDGQIDESLNVLKLAHARAPDNREVTYHYAAVLSASGDGNSALLLLNQIVDSNQDFTGREDAMKLLKTLQ